MNRTPGRLQGRTALVTGASSGIGEAVARRFAAEGARVALVSRTVKKLEALAESIRSTGRDAVAIGCDVADWDSVKAMARKADRELGALDVLVNNAGTTAPGAVADLPVEEWDRVIAVNLRGPYLVTKALWPLLTRPGARGGRSILNVASVAGKTGFAGTSAYCASKFGLRGLTESLALEAAPHGIRVTSIDPGYVGSPWHAGHPRLDEMIAPDDLADFATYLATAPPSLHVDDVTVWPARMYAD